AVLLVPLLAPQRHPGLPVHAANSPDTGAAPGPAGPTAFDEDFHEGARRLQARLDGVRRSLAADPSGGGELGPALGSVRRRAGALWRDLATDEAPGPDPVGVGLADVRRRLDALGQRVGRGPE